MISMILGGADVSFFLCFAFGDNQIQGWFDSFLSFSNKNSNKKFEFSFGREEGGG